MDGNIILHPDALFAQEAIDLFFTVKVYIFIFLPFIMLHFSITREI